MTPQQAYRRNAQSGWTRIEMLLAIYDATIAALDAGIDVLNQNRHDAYPAIRLRATQLFILLISGVDPEVSEVGVNIRSLCIFCLDQIETRDPAAWSDARNILATVREGFQRIREEGIQLEAQGAIPQLPQASTQTLLHV
ncbi:hypothetical protein SH661x_000565 [Planctomicrobium sp. SH661]|uniref:hypothetical protein n=1 Tax=Planctomicrobium sp. SH661 TaxID=3448124 RepID=UPI003F5C78CC